MQPVLFTTRRVESAPLLHPLPACLALLAGEKILLGLAGYDPLLDYPKLRSKYHQMQEQAENVRRAAAVSVKKSAEII